MAPRKTIQIEPLDKSGKTPGMESCLKSFVTEACCLPGEPLDIYPVVAETAEARQPYKPLGRRTRCAPQSPRTRSAAPLAVFKGTLRVFDTTS